MMRIVELNTAYPGKIDSCFGECGFQHCPKCGYVLINENSCYYSNADDTEFHRRWTKVINETHLELCEGDPVITLMKVEQTWKELVTRPQQEV